MRHLVAAEWLKLTTTRVLWGTIPAAVLLSAAAVSGAVLSADAAGIALQSSAGVQRALHVTGTGSIIVLVLGILIGAGEYRTLTATETYLTTPNRSKVLTAKLTIAGLSGLVVGAITAGVAFALSLVLYRSEGASFPTGDPEVWLTLGGTVLYAAMFAILGVAVGSFTRNQVVAIPAALAWLLVVENIGVTISDDIARWFPGAAGQAIVRTPDRDLLAPGTAVLVLALYTVVAIAAGLWIANTRDA